jgi:sugar lactone lactonase YvrE
MRRNLTTVLALATVGLLGAAGPALAGVAVPDPGHLQTVRTVVAFDPGEGGSFAESMAPDGHGNLIVSVNIWGAYDEATDSYGDNTGQLWRVRPNGVATEFGPAIPLGGCGMLLGVTVDDGRAFVNVYNYGPDPSCVTYTPPSGVLRVTPTSVTQQVTLPEGSWPNGLTAHDGRLYITDSGTGTVWRGSTSRVTAPTKPWFSSPLLAPTEEIGLGANGVAYRNDALFVVSYAQGLVLRVGIGCDGKAVGHGRVYAEAPALVRGDGIVFDAVGRAWVANNEGSLVVVGRDGHVTVANTAPDSLDYPTQAIIGANRTVFVTNGSYFNGMPTVVAFTR